MPQTANLGMLTIFLLGATQAKPKFVLGAKNTNYMLGVKLMERSEIIEAVAIAINLNLKEQMDGAVLAGPYDPTNWHGTGGEINLSEFAEVAISEYELLYVPDVPWNSKGPKLDVRKRP